MPTDLLAYYFPQYHADPRNDVLVHRGWTEWEVLREAQPHFPGHHWPRTPIWGATDEADPAAGRRKVAAARNAGLDGFILDWYWYDDAPYLNRFLDDALLPCLDGGDFRFALMWANHPWHDLYPSTVPDTTSGPATWFHAPTSTYAFERATQHVIDHYLTHPAYWRIDGRPYFSIYDLPDLLQAQGGVAATRGLLDSFRIRAADAGIDIHLNLVSTRFVDNRTDVLTTLGADSTTHYTWWHHDDHGFDRFPAAPYAHVAAKAAKAWPHYLGQEAVPYLPNVTVGWDPSPRTERWDHDRDRGYPYTGITADRSPEIFGTALREAIEVAERAGAPAVLINAWNEWTEDSYLEPDDRFGTAYLDTLAQITAERRTRSASGT
ncbi:hypothetical protein DMB38_30915 [Streptomyces sp. WAC 06738]|uniref:glycoside hydrolase family 99-like domain-containing protein n=1 Tax=Streptomyces sp. WAC 06738 TaxID=2203210 RepID=UPI000F709EE0|nr:glycoside hydrolase family 99-like domain-containing protein [Streptomyces sp. WAC 06738]AZM49601.1 hypothetical protein DMB38_30915 [Streptomyces sp. WAC 06738]